MEPDQELRRLRDDVDQLQADMKKIMDAIGRHGKASRYRDSSLRDGRARLHCSHRR